MRIPVVRGIIDRRILANFRVDPEVMSRVLPEPFRPKRVGEFAIGGICLIRLTNVRPKLSPLPWGIQSENAAHRIAVEWETDEGWQEGVFVPRRDTDSRLNTWMGGTVFPGVHHHATFDVRETPENFSVSMQSDDGQASVRVAGHVVERLTETSVFASLAEASAFFERGSIGYSATRTSGRLEGLELRCIDWRAEALEVDHCESSFFEDSSRFPSGSVTFDSALLMRGIEHEWHGRADLFCGPAGVC